MGEGRFLFFRDWNKPQWGSSAAGSTGGEVKRRAAAVRTMREKKNRPSPSSSPFAVNNAVGGPVKGMSWGIHHGEKGVEGRRA
jgi:hypothetical protein